MQAMILEYPMTRRKAAKLEYARNKARREWEREHNWKTFGGEPVTSLYQDDAS